MDAPGHADRVPEAVREGNSETLGEYEPQKESVLKAIQQLRVSRSDINLAIMQSMRACVCRQESGQEWRCRILWQSSKS